MASHSARVIEPVRDVFPDRYCMYPGCDVTGDAVQVVWDRQLCYPHMGRFHEAYPELVKDVLHTWLEQEARAA